MNHRTHVWVLMLAALLTLVSAVPAQLLIVSSTPANGTTGLSGEETLCFTFNADLDTTQRWPFNGEEDFQLPVAMIIAEPDDAIGFSGWSWDGASNQFCVSLLLEDETDFVFLITLARGLAGEELAAPFELHLSTAGSWGQRTVSGTLEREDGGSVENAAVALFHEFPFGSEGARLIAGSVVEGAGGGYTVPYVREGWYFPISALDTNSDGYLDPSQNDHFGYYDENGDGLPDSVLVGATDLTGIDMSMRPLTQLLARERLVQAAAATQPFAPDAQLQGIFSAGPSVNEEGRCFGWMYHFHSEQEQLYVDVFVNDFSLEASASDSSDFPPMATLDPGFMDSDAALAIAMNAGGALFEEQLVERYRSLLVGNFYWIWPDEPEAFMWMVRLEGSDGDGNWQDFMVLLDALTGEVYYTDGSGLPESPGAPADFELGTPWPNPFNPAVHLPYDLARAQDLRLVVYNLAGQLVAELARGPQAAGHHEALLRAGDWPSGLYLVALEGEGRRAVRKIALIK